MISFDAAHAAVHYPSDRRFRIWIRPSFRIAAVLLVLLPVLAAWIELLLVGLPLIPPIDSNNFAGPHGFPLWVRSCHFLNFLFLMMLIRSGLSILVDHPRLYFNDDCTPGSEWIRLTPLRVPTDRL
jgi:sulfoxide reductase catalytic subunit YedY